MTDKLPVAGTKPNVLIVDDSPENLDVLTGILNDKDYTIRPFADGRAALRSMRTNPPDLILLDINMGEMDGFALCETIKQTEGFKDIPVIFISSRLGTADKVKAFSVGGVDYITKPFQNEEVTARVGTHLNLRKLQKEMAKTNLHLENLVRLKMKEISESHMATIFALAKLAESRDDDTGRHLERIQIFCRLLTQRLAQEKKFERAITPQFVENIVNASPLHDIGKVAISDSILLKPGRLTPEEFETMKTHVNLGAATLRLVHDRYSKNAFVQMGIDIAGHHHERWDGTGYPDGLAGGAIPLCARIVSVVDTYDAMRSKRCYKEPRPHREAVAEIDRCRGTQFDPDIAGTFVDMNAVIASEWENLRD